ncbi:MAG TPA: YcaO-like family protein [Polyangiaceae bacterium]|jgi:hypothetical protein
MAAARELAELAKLCETLPLPAGWSTPESFCERTVIGDAALELVGLAARWDEQLDATGSAADIGRVPVDRAYFELLERVSVLEAIKETKPRHELLNADGNRIGFCSNEIVFPVSPARASWSYSRSNGVAAGATWSDACEAASRELTERDRVLRSWYGETSPRALSLECSALLTPLEPHYAFERYVFPVGSARSRSDLEVVGVFAFPLQTPVAFAYGLGAGASLADALGKAERECLQVAGFLWGEELPTHAPEPASTPGYHQDFYLMPGMHARLRSWLQGEHVRHGSGIEPISERALPTSFVDLTPTHLRGRFAVAKAISSDALALTFGRGHPRLKPSRSTTFAVHPIS